MRFQILGRGYYLMDSQIDRLQMEPSTPLVSVVIPAYNAASYIDETLSSLECQTLSDIEIICVDDGSADATLSIIKRHEDSDSRVTSIHQTNQGAGVARNAGAEVAKGKWLAFLDADDIYCADFLEVMVSAASEGNADMAICEYDRYLETTGKTKPGFRFPHNVVGPFAIISDYSNCLFQFATGEPFNKIYRTSFIKSCGLRFQELSNSNDAFFTFSALASADKVAIVRRQLVSYRVAEGFSIQDDLAKRPTTEKCLCVYRAMSALRRYCLDHKLLNDRSLQSLHSLAICNSFASVVKAVGHDELLKEVHNFYQKALVNEWDVSKPDKDAGFEVRSKYELMVNSTAEQFAWVYKEAGKSRSGGFTRKALLGVKTLLVILRNRFY